jgi:hypothetical protein
VEHRFFSHLAITNQQMATITTKPSCATCFKERGIFKCDGCSRIFCLQHTTDHHQEIVKQMDQVDDTRNLVQKILAQEMVEPRHDLKTLHDELTHKIDVWERESISKIQKVAKDTRNDLFQYTIGRLTNAKLKLQQLTDVETDLREWDDKLNKLKEELITPPNVVVREDYTKLISNICVNYFGTKEVFDRSSGNTVFEENGKVVYVNNGPDIYTEVRGHGAYSTGKHTVSLKIEQLDGWILFGIITQSSPLQIHSYVSPSCYGWYNSAGCVYAAGKNIGGRGCDAVQNDTVHLVIDCDNRLIRLTNERTNLPLELPIDIEKCPFPWQLHLNLNLAPTRIRILS